MNDTEKTSHVLDAIRLIAGMDEAWSWDIYNYENGTYGATLISRTGNVINMLKTGSGDTPEEAIANAIKEMRK